MLYACNKSEILSNAVSILRSVPVVEHAIRTASVIASKILKENQFDALGEGDIIEPFMDVLVLPEIDVLSSPWLMVIVNITLGAVPCDQVLL